MFSHARLRNLITVTMTSNTRHQALSLYRRLLRAARQWPGSAEEAEYIWQEAQQQFRARRAASSEEVAQALEEGEKRLELALHYGIAYPRLYHADQFAKVPYFQTPKLEQQPEPEALTSGIKDKGVAARLAAAARRRQERKTQQQQQQQQQQQVGQEGGGISGGGS